MAKMYRTDAMRFPNVARLVRSYLPRLPSVREDTWQAFRQHSTLPAERARRALSWGNPPQLRLTTQLRPELVGQFMMVGSDIDTSVIWLNSIAASRIESDWARWEARLRIEALVLHEMTHWGDWLQDSVGSSHETGEAFERSAYRFQPVRFDYRRFSYPRRLESQAPPE